jgi:hypothetical protein
MDASQTKSPTALDDATIVVPQHVVHRAFPTETVLLNLETGKYHGLNPTAGRMYEVLEETGSLDETASRIAAEFELSVDSVRADLRDLCTGLMERGLLKVAEANA